MVNTNESSCYPPDDSACLVIDAPSYEEKSGKDILTSDVIGLEFCLDSYNLPSSCQLL